MANATNPYSHVLLGISVGKQIQWKSSSGRWHNVTDEIVLREISDEDSPPDRYRVAPNTILINGIEVPVPEKVAPSVGAVYWTIGPFLGAQTVTWIGDEDDYYAFNNGLVWLTEADVRAAFDALTKPLREYVGGAA